MRNIHAPKLLSLSILAALAGCANLPDLPRQQIAPLSAEPPPSAGTTPALPPTAQDTRPQPALFKGNDRVVNLPASRKPLTLQGEDVTLNFEQAPLTDVVHAILGDLLKLGYSIDQPLKGEITLRTQSPIPRDQILPILESLLQANGAALVRDDKGFYHIGPIEALRGTAPVRSNILAPGYSTVIVPLKYIGAAEMAEILKPLAPPEALVRVDTVRNLLVLSGTANQVEGWTDIITSFDVDLFKGMSVGIFPLEHASVKEAEAALKLLLGSGAGAQPASPTGGQAASATAVSPLTGMIRVLPIERLNSLLVVTPRAHYLDQVQDWIGRLDRPPENDFEPQLFVYPVQNGTARHLAQLLNGLFSGMLGNAQDQSALRQPQDSGLAPGLAASNLTSGASSGTESLPSLGALGGGPGGTLGNGASATSTGAFGAMERGLTGSTRTAASQTVAQIALAPQVRVVADEENNALIIHAPRKDYRKIESALKQLDVAPTQVLIEASILEVTLTDDLKYGLEWYLDNALGSGWRGSSQLNLNASGGIGAMQPGFAFTLTNPAGAVRAVLNSLAEKSLVKVISSPSVMVLDNQTASIHVGDQQPIRSAETLTTGGNLTTSIQYKDTGVMLAVTPSVNASGIVSMNIRQSVTDVGQVDSATGQRSFLQREVGTRVAVRSGETIVIGGLIRDNRTQGKTGIPWLMDLPAVGNLFSTTTDNGQRTELLVMITPRVLTSDQELRDISREMRQRLHGLRILETSNSASPVTTVPDQPAP